MTAAIEKKLIANFTKNSESETSIDFKPVVKFFGGGACTWLFTEYNPVDRTFFGLCDLGLGFAELGYVSRDELEAIRFKPFNLPVERDRFWGACGTMSEYVLASKGQRIVEGTLNHYPDEEETA